MGGTGRQHRSLWLRLPQLATWQADRPVGYILEVNGRFGDGRHLIRLPEPNCLPEDGTTVAAPCEEKMATPELTDEALKQAIKEAVAEALQEQRDLLRELLAEALEDLGLSAAIREGERTDPVSRDEVFHVFEDPG